MWSDHLERWELEAVWIYGTAGPISLFWSEFVLEWQNISKNKMEIKHTYLIKED